jgi:hypothetical protein
VQWNLNDAVAAIPDEYTKGVTDVRIVGAQSEGASTEVYVGNLESGDIKVTPDRFPLSLDISMTVETTCGTIDCRKKVALYDGVDGSYRTTLDVNDFSSGNSGAGCLTDHLNLIEAQLAFNAGAIENLRNLAVADCEHFSYPVNDIHGVMLTHSAQLCSVTTRLENIGDEKVLMTSCATEDCAAETTEASLQETLDQLQSDLCDKTNQINDLLSRVADLEIKVKTCREGA